MTRRCVDCGDDFDAQREYHRLCWPCWRDRDRAERDLPPPWSEPPPALPVLDSTTIRAAVALTHPDRHPPERRDRATRVTQALTRALALVRGMER